MTRVVSRLLAKMPRQPEKRIDSELRSRAWTDRNEADEKNRGANSVETVGDAKRS